MKRLQGAITALVTPFKKNGAIDIEALKNLVDWQIKSGIHGLVPCGSTGEAATMTPEECQTVIKTVVETTAKRVPVIAGATSNVTERAVEYSIAAQKAGADALLHATPYYNKPTISGLIAHYKAIAKATNLPIVLYNVPGRTGLNLLPAMAVEIAKKVDHVVGIKEASGSITQIMELIHKAPVDFITLSGDDAMTFPVMALGGKGIISVASNEIPSEMSQLAEAALKGDWSKARKIHFQWLDLMDANFIETNPQPVKTALHLMGKVGESFRLPLVPMKEANKQILRGILNKHKLI